MHVATCFVLAHSSHVHGLGSSGVGCDIYMNRSFQPHTASDSNFNRALLVMWGDSDVNAPSVKACRTSFMTPSFTHHSPSLKMLGGRVLE